MVNSWKEFFIEICKTLYDLDEGILRNCTFHTDFVGKDNRMISNNGQNMRTPLRVFENFYIEINLNANSILGYCRKIVEKYGYDTEVRFRLRS